MTTLENVPSRMLDKLYNLNLTRLSAVGFVLLFISLSLAFGIGVPVFLYLFSQFQGKGVVAIPILGGGAILIGSFTTGQWLLRRLGISIHRYPAGTIVAIGPRMKAVQEELKKFRPFLDADSLTPGATVVIGQKSDEDTAAFDANRLKRITVTLDSDPALVVWVIVNTGASDSSEVITNRINQARELLADKCSVPADRLIFAVDSLEVATPDNMSIPRGWPQIIDAICQSKGAEQQFNFTNAFARMRQPFTWVCLFAALFHLVALTYMFSSPTNNRPIGALFLINTPIFAAWLYGLHVGHRASFIAGLLVALVQCLIAAILIITPMFDFDVFRTSERQVRDFQTINQIVVVCSVLLAGVCWWSRPPLPE